MNAVCKTVFLPDIQAQADLRELRIDAIGIKGVDEKYVTERAYDNPEFVEDLVRDVAHALEQDPRIAAYVIEVENFESIHNHSAYARIERETKVAGTRAAATRHESAAGLQWAGAACSEAFCSY